MTTATGRAHPTSLLRISELDVHELNQLLVLAEHMKQLPHAYRDAHRGKALGCYFSKPSTRTRVSLESAAARLGLTPIMLRPDELQLGRGEPISDTAAVLSGYLAAMTIRTFEQAEVEQFAAHSTVPVINALTDDHHPCQALADLLTLQERGDLFGRRLAYVGDGNNVAHSLMEAGALVGMHVSVACPTGYRPDPLVVAAAQTVASEHGGRVEVVEDPYEAVSGADAVYTDVWVSMGDEEEREQRLGDLAPYRVTPELMAAASSEAVFMHCLPAHRGQEVDATVIDGRQSVVIRQAHNRLPTEQALIHTLITRRWDGDD
jgi:ornithine carbamoyltransferase